MIALEVDSGAGARRIDLLSYLSADAEERAHEDEYAWIKALRALPVDGTPFRSRFTLRGDSLWWFAELYLHKQQTILQIMRTLAAFEALVEQERPLAVRHISGGYAGVVAAAAAARKVRYSGRRWPRLSTALFRMDVRGAMLASGARLSRLRPRVRRPARPSIAAFVHRAFWRSEAQDGSAESYIGPVLQEIETRLPAGGIQYVGVGPRSNFRARRWWHPVVAPIHGRERSPIVSIERYAPTAALKDSRRIYLERDTVRQGLWASPAIRAHAVIRNCDCWPLVREELAGVALLQFPWSARAMDEAAAALETLQPEAAVTYAEAGGWGRAIALECRRRGVPLAGLQHGFVYRHWLNYCHEPDEMAPDPGRAADRGFPAPAATLVFDEQTARHLSAAGRYPRETLVVTGSARLDELIAAVRRVDRAAIDRVRRDAGASDGQAVILFAGKEREARGSLPALIDAVRTMDDVQLAIKPHPAETPEAYDALVARAAHVRVLPAGTPLPPALAAARGVVTVNSTVAVDAMALGVPSLVIGLPNNLTPFVDAGVMLGAGSAVEIRAAIARLLYDQEFRGRLARATEGRAAARAADAILALAAKRRG